MIRFFCTKCNKVKRVRILPKVIRAGHDLIKDVKQRTGECNYHSFTSMSHREYNRSK